jgi:hypothetical protein
MEAPSFRYVLLNHLGDLLVMVYLNTFVFLHLACDSFLVQYFGFTQDVNLTKKSATPTIHRTLPTTMVIILFLLSVAVNSDQGLCFLPIAIPITIPAPIPTAKPIGYPSTITCPLSFYCRCAPRASSASLPGWIVATRSSECQLAYFLCSICSCLALAVR